MLLNNQTVFIHIPKCAGTSITATLAPYAAYETHEDDGSNKANPSWNPSADPTLLHDKASVILANKDDHFSFTCIRNVYERWLSWTMWKRGRVSGFDKSHFMQNLEKARNPEVRHQPPWNWGTTLYYLDRPVDYIMKYETIDDDWEEVCGIMRIKHIPLQRKFISKKYGDYHQYYDNEMRALADEIFAEDIAHFGWEF